MRKFKVLQIIGSSGIGGGEKVFCSLLKHLNKDKFDIFVACPADGPMFAYFKKYAIEVKAFDFKNWLNPLTIISLKRYMQEKEIDIVHTHIYNADFMGIVAANLAGVPGRFATVHGHNFTGTGEFDLRSIKNFFCSFIYRAVYIFCNRIITVCYALKQDLIKRPGIKVSEEKISVIYNGIDLEEMMKCDTGVDPRLNDILSNNNLKSIGVIGSFDKVKGHRILLKAIPEVLKEFEDARFLLVGEGEERKRLIKLTKRYKVGKSVIFTGILQDIIKVISACELIVLPSLLEGLPLIIMEAMYLGKPVVATRVGGVPELVRENETGILISPNDHKELSRAIIKMLRDRKLASLMGSKGKEIICNKDDIKFQAQYMAKEVEKLYQTFLY